MMKLKKVEMKASTLEPGKLYIWDSIEDDFAEGLNLVILNESLDGFDCIADDMDYYFCDNICGQLYGPIELEER